MATGENNASHNLGAGTSEATLISHILFAHTVNMRPFWHDMPALWFAKLEANFSIHQITGEDTKYDFTVSQLDGKTASVVEDIIMQKPLEEPYSKLKQELISRFTETDMNRIRQRLETQEIGDKKPSCFLRSLKVLAGDSFPEEELKSIWLNKLPLTYRIVYYGRQPMSLDQMVEMADELYDVL